MLSNVERSVRIRLEGRVEQLERAIARWEDALSAARRHDFANAAHMLECGEVNVPTYQDPGLVKLTARQDALRRELESLVVARLEIFGVPAIDLARGAHWLTTEPVRYEHHRLTLSVFRVLLPLIFLLFPLTGLAASIGGLGGVAVVTSCAVAAIVVAVKRFGWSHIVLTDRRILIEGRSIDLTHVKHVVFVKTIDRQWPAPMRIEFRNDRRVFEVVRLRDAPHALRIAFERMGLQTSSDWSLF